MLFWLRSCPNGVFILLLNSLLMSLGFFALIPYLSYHLSVNLLWTPFLIGALLMIRQFTQQGLSLIAGMLADRIGYKMMLTLGLVIRGIGFSMFAFVETTPFLFLAAVITGIGGAIFEPTSSAAISTLTPVSERGKIFAVKKVMNNIGIALAALLGAILITFDFMYISLICGGIFFLIGLLNYIFMPKVHVQIKPIAMRDIWGTVMNDKYFVSFTIVTVGFYFLYMQLFLTIPLKAVELSNHPQAVSFVYLLLSILIIIAQYPINRIISKFNMTRCIQWGLAFMGAGLVILGLSNTFSIFILGFLFFVVGIMITEPTSFDFISKLAKPEMMASYFGFASLAMALGGGLSQGLGGFLLQAGQAIGFPALIWSIAGLISFISIVGLAFLEASKNREKTASTMKEIN